MLSKKRRKNSVKLSNRQVPDSRAVAVDIALVVVVVGNSLAVEVDNSADSLVDTGLDSWHSSALWELPSRQENTVKSLLFSRVRSTG